MQRLCVLFVLIAAFAGVCRGEPKVDDPPLALPSKTLAALDELTGAFDSLELAREAADSLASNRKPEHLDKDKWARLSDRMEAAAAALARTPESANFDDAQAAVNPGDFDSPTKHDHAVEDLREKIGTVSDAFRRGRDEEDRLERFIHSAFKADNVVGDLIRTGRRLGQTPEVQQYFAWRWEDLEGRIRPAIRSAIREMIRRQHSIGVERDKVGIMSSKLKNGQGIWERSPVEGFWSVPVPDTTVQYAVNAPGDREATFQDVSFGFRLSFTGKLMGGRMDAKISKHKPGIVPDHYKIPSSHFDTKAGTYKEGELALEFEQSGPGRIKCSVTFHGTARSNREMSGTLVVERPGDGNKPAWRLELPVIMKKSN